MSTDSAGTGYTLVAADGGVFSFNSPYLGSLGGTPPITPVVALATLPGDQGYYLLDSEGNVYAFGDAPNYGGVNAENFPSYAP
jgi:hypothetical protein